MTDFRNAEELLELCSQRQQPISEIMKRRECDLSDVPMMQIHERMALALKIMRQSAIVPGLLLSLQEAYGFSDEQMVNVLFNAGAIGYLAMRNATVAGAVGGCAATPSGCKFCHP